MSKTAPKVFISHAGEDKTFVREFSTRLKEKGVDVWFDEWEILPGDKLIGKIFEEGIGHCDAFIIVLSKTSVGKPWVVEELDAALVRRINQGIKIIPVRIDKCEVPVALQATAWTNIDPEEDHNTEFHKVLSSIFGVSAKPPLGERPPVFESPKKVGRYSIEETRILEFMLKHMLATGRHHITRSEVAKAFDGLPPTIVIDAIELFESDGLIFRKLAMGPLPFEFQFVDVQPYAWVRYAPTVLDIDTTQDYERVLAIVVSEGSVTGPAISKALNLESIRLKMAVGYLESKGYIVCRTATGKPLTVEATARGRRGIRD